MNSVFDIKDIKNLIIIIEQGKINSKEVKKINELINIYEIKVHGWFLIDKKNTIST